MYVEPEVGEPEFAGPVAAFWFLASAVGSRSLRGSVSGPPQARHGGPILESALGWRFLAGCLVILVGSASPTSLERSDSEEPLSAHLASPPRHFRLATVSVQVSPLASVFRPVLSANRQASRQISLAKH
jgi:hypothetical protein